MANQTDWKLTKWVIIATIVAYIVPYMILGSNAYVRIHDTLEGEWTWLKLLADNHNALNFSPSAFVPQQMKGLPRNAFPSGLNVNMWLVLLLGAYKGYLVSSLLIRIIGFFSMILLLRSYFLKEAENKYIVWFCALIFSVLPVFTPFGLSVMGQPLLLWAFLNLQAGKRFLPSYAIILAFPFYCSIVWLPMPFLWLLALTGIYFLVKERRLNGHYVFGAILFMVAYFLVNLPMLTLTKYNPSFVPHRLAYDLYIVDRPYFIKSVLDTLVMYFFGHYHSATFVSLGCMFAIFMVIRSSDKLLIAILTAIVGICIFQGFYSYPEFLLAKKIAIMNSFRFNRFHILLPFLWFFAFALALEKMRNSTLLKPLVIPFLCLQLLMVLIGNDEFLHNYRTLIGHQTFPNYENYLAPKQFTEIKNYINKPQDSYYVASLGLSPTIAQYNGFYTLDGLASIYDLNYKLEFRKIFAAEIDKSPAIQQYFDGWGNRCYIFSAELGMKAEAYTCFNHKQRFVEHFDFNTAAFTKIGGSYLISAVEIRNCEQLGLKLERTFMDDQSWWKIYLYSVKKQA